MIFEIFDERGVQVFRTPEEECIPNSSQLKLMVQTGYKFKLDGKNITKKKIEEMLACNKKGKTK